MENSANTPSVRIEDELEKYGTYATNTVGNSMSPLFKTHRDAVAMVKPDRDIRKYDIVLYKDKKDRYLLHRVIGFSDDCYVIRGDNTYVKEYVPKEKILAYVVSFNRAGKHRSISDTSYKIYTRVWHFIYPLRLFWQKMIALLVKIKRKLIG